MGKYRLFRNCIITTALLYTAVYLSATFIMWEWKNPFQWVIDLPTYDGESRGAIFVSFIMYWGINIAANIAVIHEGRDKEKNND